MKTSLPTLCVCFSLLLAGGCATLDGPTEPHDPWERFNRSMFSFNQTLDENLMKPVAEGYRTVTPDPVETGISNVFSNLDEIRIIANDLLQFKLLDALSDTGRFLINSTLGIYGLFDVASHMGLEKHGEDFGQTLGAWGLESGPYLVLPFFGPSSVRDGIGRIGDYQFDPIAEVDDDSTRVGLRVLETVSGRAELLKAGKILDEAAYDPYSYMREAYLQRRKSLVYDGNPPVDTSTEEIDLFSDEPSDDEQ